MTQALSQKKARNKKAKNTWWIKPKYLCSVCVIHCLVEREKYLAYAANVAG